MWTRVFVFLYVVLAVHGFSKYGRSCKDIGCLNSEVCVIVEDPCSYGRQSDCGSYPTCKKKTSAESGGGNQNVPVAKPTTPKPIADILPAQPAPPRYDDDLPNYPPPPPPRDSSYNRGGSTYGGGGGSTNYGGGGSSNNYGGGSNPGGSTSGGTPGGGLFGPGGLFSNTGLFGNNAGGSRPSSGTSDGFPFSSFGFGNNGGSSSGSSSGGNPLTNILTNILGNITKGGSLLPSLNTRPIVENRNSDPSYPYNNPSNPYGNPYGNQPGYPGNNPYQRPSGYYPSYNQPPGQQPSLQNGYVAKNYQGSHSGSRSGATTTIKPVSYGWNLGAGIICLLLTRLILVNNVLIN